MKRHAHDWCGFVVWDAWLCGMGYVMVGDRCGGFGGIALGYLLSGEHVCCCIGVVCVLRFRFCDGQLWAGLFQGSKLILSGDSWGQLIPLRGAGGTWCQLCVFGDAWSCGTVVIGRWPVCCGAFAAWRFEAGIRGVVVGGLVSSGAFGMLRCLRVGCVQCYVVVRVDVVSWGSVSWWCWRVCRVVPLLGWVLGCASLVSYIRGAGVWGAWVLTVRCGGCDGDFWYIVVRLHNLSCGLRACRVGGCMFISDERLVKVVVTVVVLALNFDASECSGQGDFVR